MRFFGAACGFCSRSDSSARHQNKLLGWMAGGVEGKIGGDVIDDLLFIIIDYFSVCSVFSVAKNQDT